MVSGHFRSPGALPTDLPCHGRHLRHRGWPGQANTIQTGGTWAPAPPPSTSHTPDLTQGLTLDWGSLPSSHSQEAGPKGAPSLPDIGVGGQGPGPSRGRRTPSTPSSLEEGLPPTEPKVGRGCLTQKAPAYRHPQLTAPPQDQTGQARPQAPLLAASPGKARGPGAAPLANAPRAPARPVDPGGAPRRAATWGNRGPGTRRPPLRRRAGAGAERGRGAHLLFSQPRSWLAGRPLVPSSARPPARLSVPGSEGGRDARRGRGGARGGT